MECFTTPRARGVGWAKMRPARPLSADQTSVLDAVGVEIVAIVSPVSICMFLCVVLVRLLRVDGDNATANIQGGIASAAYNEEAGDSTATKASGALLNSLVFVAFITCATFGIFFLFKHNCTKLIWGYLGFSGLLIFGVLGAVIGMEVLQKLNIALDHLYVMGVELLRSRCVSDVLLASAAGDETRVPHHNRHDRCVLLHAHSRMDHVDVTRRHGAVRRRRGARTRRTAARPGGARAGAKRGHSSAGVRSTAGDAGNAERNGGRDFGIRHGERERRRYRPIELLELV